MRPLAVTALVLVLLAATAAAFGVVERLKLERSPVTAPRFDRLLSPTCGCKRSLARLALTLRRPDRVDAAIVDGAGEYVRSLTRDAERPRGVATFAWDGRNDAGEAVRDGLYRLRIALERSDRTILIPTPIRVDGTPPAIRLVSFRPHVISPDGDGRKDRVRFVYRASERSYPMVVVRGIYAVRGMFRPAGRGHVPWRGRLFRRPVRAGSYRVSLRAVDGAGNRSRPTPSVAVRVRYIELARPRLRARVGGTLRARVDTDAKTFDWRLVPPGRSGSTLGRAVRAGTAREVVTIRLPRSLTPGRYLLRVSANGRGDRAVVTVVRGRAR